MQVVQFCTPLCALIKLASGSYCWLPAESSHIQSVVGFWEGPSILLLCPVVDDYCFLEISGLYKFI